jgi:hypothetical protein
MKINLTKKQYEILVKTVYLGNWVATSCITNRRDSPIAKKYDEISDYIYSLAPDFGLSKDIELDLEFADDNEDEPETRLLIDEYDDENFWQELPDRLGERDFFRKYPTEEIRKMTDEDYFTKMMECNIAWENEFEENGIERLEIMDK